MEIRIPQVLRARGFRLYLANKQRLVDLWLNGGAAVLGHTPPNLLRELKNTASRGLYAPFPHFTEGRLIKALSKLLPGRSFRLYAALPQELIVLFESGAAKLWRPYVDPTSPYDISKRLHTEFEPKVRERNGGHGEKESVLIPVIPGIQTWRNGLPMGLCVVAAQSETPQSAAHLSQLLPNDALPPVLLAVAARGVHDLLAAPDRGNLHYPRIKKVLEAKDCLWQREGIYLSLKETLAASEWEAVFNKFLEAGFLLPPEPTQPLILPGELSDGEEAKLSAVLGASL